MEKLIKYKWNIAALTLITLPLSFYATTHESLNVNEDILIIIGMFPLLFAVTIELLGEVVTGWRQYKETGEFPPSDEGSPIGNKIAVILAILFGLIFVLPTVWIMLKGLT
jgi:hypothetical protein